jgi:tetratricopeptide (TPR) repeat protein
MPHQVYLKVLILLVVAAAVFGNALGNGLVFDDEMLITGQRDLLSNPANIVGSTVSMVFKDKSVTALYRPGLMFTYFLDFQLWQGSAFGFHFTNLLLHLLCVFLVFFLVNKLWRDEWLAFFAGLIFAVHPVQSEAVAWVSGRNDPLLLVFILLTFLFYLRATEKPSTINLIGSLTSFLAALLIKETAVVFPLAFISYDLLIRRENWRQIFKPEYFWLAGVTVIYFAWRFLIFKGGSFVGLQQQEFSLSQLMLFPLVYGFYLKALVWPGAFSIIPFVKMSMLPPEYIWRCLPFVLLVGSFIWSARKMPAVAFGIAWGFIALLPVSSLVIIPVLVMEHRLYTAMFGLSLALAWVGREVYRRVDQKAFLVGVTVIFCLLAWQTVERNGYFHDPLTLWLAAVRQNPYSEQVHGNLGATLVDIGDYSAGEKELLLAAQMAPDNPVNQYNLGYLYLITNREEQGIALMRKAVELDPIYLKAHYNIGMYAVNHGDRATAVREMEKVLKINPLFRPAQEWLQKLERGVR